MQRAAVLARGQKQVQAYPGVAMFSLDMLVIFFPEIFQRGQDRIGPGLPQAAQRRILDDLAQFL